MLALTLRRALTSLAVLLVVSFLVFLVVYLSPGDPGRDHAGTRRVRGKRGVD